jgi:hypothetical protein
MSRFVEGPGEHRHATEPFVLEVLPDAGRLGVRLGGGEDDEPDRIGLGLLHERVTSRHQYQRDYVEGCAR